MLWFASLRNVIDIKSLYRKLAMAHHPDHGGDTRTMQDINEQYLQALRSCDGQTTKGDDGREHKYSYNEADESEIINKVSELLRLRMSGVDIMLIGKWIWCTGNTRENKDALKQAGLSWHSKRVAWYWHPAESYSHYNRRVSLDDLAYIYGARSFANKENEMAV